MAASSGSIASSNKFETSLGSEQQLSLEFDADISRLSIQVSNSSRFIVYRKSFNKSDEILQITGTSRLLYIFSNNTCDKLKN